MNGQVQIIPEPDRHDLLRAGHAPPVCSRPSSRARSDVAVEPRRRTSPTFSTEDAEKLGIKEPVGTITAWKGQPQVKSFTTYHACCEARVTNIHRIADIVRGAIVKPGETFSINDHVGQRTTEKGFVEAGVIDNGEHVTRSAAACRSSPPRMFNAAFFAGLRLRRRTRRTRALRPVPVRPGGHAGLRAPGPGSGRTTRPTAIMIWTSYTDTSVTVTLYSTQYVYGQQTAQATSKVGPCTRVRTERTRTWADGHKSVDHVGSLYRPAEGVDCPGL